MSQCVMKTMLPTRPTNRTTGRAAGRAVGILFSLRVIAIVLVGNSVDGVCAIKPRLRFDRTARQQFAPVADQPSAGLPGGRWVAPYSGPTPARTPTQVYQQTVHAELDGQLAHLNLMAAARH
jgi:hypothetical protein